MDKWHRVLGELCSMEIDLSGAQIFFRHMQESLYHVQEKRVMLTKGVHQAL